MYTYQSVIGELPFVDDPNFIEKINAVIKDHAIDFIYPAHDSVVLKLAQASRDGLLQCPVVTSSAETCEIARSKRASYEFFTDIIPVPKVYERSEVAEDVLPVFLKPDVGQGSKGTATAKTLADIDFYLEQDKTLLILENLPGKEYTIDCFTDTARKLLYCRGRERMRIAGGISVHSEFVHDVRFEEIANKINNALKFTGAWFFQVKARSNGELVLMEIAPRIAGTMGLDRAIGVNLPLLSLHTVSGTSVAVSQNNYEAIIDRALCNRFSISIEYDTVYLDLDDTIIFEGTVNPFIMAFVYQCQNKGKAVHLLTRHKSDLDATLRKYRLHGVFDSVIWLKNDSDEKHCYIDSKSAILIDDSFMERQKVAQACGIPVFDAHMIEVLMDKY